MGQTILESGNFGQKFGQNLKKLSGIWCFWSVYIAYPCTQPSLFFYITDPYHPSIDLHSSLFKPGAFGKKLTLSGPGLAFFYQPYIIYI